VLIPYIVSRFIFYVISKFVFFIKYDVRGREYIPSKGAFLLISNHLSFIDPVAIGVNCPRILTFMARRDLFDKRFFGAWMKSVGVIAIKRDRADLKSIKDSLRLLDKGRALVVFPEGRRLESPQESFHQLKRGFLLLAKKSGVPIIAAKIEGSEKAMPKDTNRVQAGSKINVTFSKPFFIGRNEEYGEALKRLEAVLATL